MLHAAQEVQRPPLLIIAGPTATGKTRIALELAEHAPVEVISADSRQVYCGLDIGTAKPTLTERRRVPHHLVDISDPGEVFNAHRFARMARTAIVDIERRGARPVVVGGTGFYIQALLTGSPLGATPPDHDLRSRLTRELKAQGPDPLIRRLRDIAPERAAAIDLNNSRRLVRALEIAESQRHETWPESQIPTHRPIPAYVLGLEVEPAILAERIAQRTERMFQDGLLDEARWLRDRGYDRTLPALSWRRLRRSPGASRRPAIPPRSHRADHHPNSPVRAPSTHLVSPPTPHPLVSARSRASDRPGPAGRRGEVAAV